MLSGRSAPVRERSCFSAISTPCRARSRCASRATSSLVAAAGHATSSRAFDRLDCRLEAVSTKDPDGLAERAELRVGYRLPPGIDHRDVTEQALTLVRAGVAGRERSVLDITVDAAEQPVRTSRT